MPLPEGYRKAIRLMKQAEKFGRPIICLVDTPGAFCGLEAEERGQGEAIARSLFEMSALTVPVFSLIIGEGGSGGALAMAVANEVWMLENSVYSILSPEGYASILWKDSSLAKDAAKVMKMTANDLYNMNIIDGIISEPDKLTEENFYVVTEQVKVVLEKFLSKQTKKTGLEIATERYNRFRNM
jgi:acetyl-CoA carboxylase carboxyl transferase subunit beta